MGDGLLAPHIPAIVNEHDCARPPAQTSDQSAAVTESLGFERPRAGKGGEGTRAWRKASRKPPWSLARPPMPLLFMLTSDQEAAAAAAGLLSTRYTDARFHVQGGKYFSGLRKKQMLFLLSASELRDAPAPPEAGHREDETREPRRRWRMEASN